MGTLEVEHCLITIERFDFRTDDDARVAVWNIVEWLENVKTSFPALKGG